MATVAAPWRVGNHPALGWFPTIHEEIVCCAVGNLELMLGRMMLASWQNFLVELWLGCGSCDHQICRDPSWLFCFSLRLRLACGTESLAACALVGGGCLKFQDVA